MSKRYLKEGKDDQRLAIRNCQQYLETVLDNHM